MLLPPAEMLDMKTKKGGLTILPAFSAGGKISGRE